MSSPVALAVAAALTVVLGHNVALAQAGMQSAGKTDPALTKLAKELEAALAPTGGTKMTDTGKYVEVFKQVGGKWLIALDIFNSDLPPPKQGS